MTKYEIFKDYHKQICELKSRLRESDYKAIKFAEGEIPEEEYAPIRDERRAWREEINSLEVKIAELKKGQQK